MAKIDGKSYRESNASLIRFMIAMVRTPDQCSSMLRFTSLFDEKRPPIEPHRVPCILFRSCRPKGLSGVSRHEPTSHVGAYFPSYSVPNWN